MMFVILVIGADNPTFHLQQMYMENVFNEQSFLAAHCHCIPLPPYLSESILCALTKIENRDKECHTAL